MAVRMREWATKQTRFGLLMIAPTPDASRIRLWRSLAMVLPAV
jgi:hypothetical protein